MPQNGSENTIVYKIPSRKRVMREFRLNRQWLMGTIGAYVMYTLVLTIFALGFENDWSFWQSLYFTVLSTLTGGYGDLSLSTAGKVLLCINSFAGLVLLGLILAIVALSLQADEDDAAASAVAMPQGPDKPGTEAKIVSMAPPQINKAAEGIMALIELMNGAGKQQKIKSGDLDIVIHKETDHAEYPEYSHVHLHIQIR